MKLKQAIFTLAVSLLVAISKVAFSAPVFQDKQEFKSTFLSILDDQLEQINYYRDKIEKIDTSRTGQLDSYLIDYLYGRFEFKENLPEKSRLKRLKSRLYIPPRSYIFARSALFTSYGKNNNVMSLNNPLGVYCGHKLCQFTSINEGIEVYIVRVISDPYYQEYRRILSMKENMTGAEFADTLIESEHENKSNSKIKKLIFDNNLDNSEFLDFYDFKVNDGIENYLYLLNIKDVMDRKRVFLSLIISKAHKINVRILESKRNLYIIDEKISKNEILNLYQRELVNKLSRQYRVAPTVPFYEKVNILLHKIDVIPPSLIASYAALSTNWGESVLFQRRNQIVWSLCAGEYCSFPNADQSIYNLMIEMNTAKKYALFRSIRGMVRRTNKPLSGWAMAQGLEYNKGNEGLNFVDSIQKIIRSQGIDEEYRVYPQSSLIYPYLP